MGPILIPKFVHRIWIGGDEPEWLAGFADSWEAAGWPVRRWTDETVGELFPLRNQALYDRAPRLCPGHVGQLRSDVLRYEILERFGGIYADADMECLRPLDPLLENVEAFAAWEVPGAWVNNALMGAVAGHPFVSRLIDQLPSSARRNRGARPNRISGPQFVTRQYQRTRDIEILPRELVYPYGYAEIGEHAPGEDWGEAYTVHHWANQRRERGVPV